MGTRLRFRDKAAELDQVLSQGKAGARKAKVSDVEGILSTILADLSAADAKHQESDKDAAQALARALSRAVAPVVAAVDEVESPGAEDVGVDDEDGEDSRVQTQNRVNRRCAAAVPSALQALELLAAKTSPREVADDEVLLTLATLTDSSQDWKFSEDDSRRLSGLLSQLLDSGYDTRGQFIVEGILQRYLRPLFSKSKPASVTESGRKAEYTDPAAGRGEGISDDSAATKPWKYLDFRAIPLVDWAVGTADEHLVDKRWPLFLPVLLTLADDSATDVRQRGLGTLAKFIDKLPSKTLHAAGLAKVFEDAIVPTLGYLPNLTPENESVQLLVPAFEALRRLAAKQPTPPGQYKNKLLDRLLREGVFHGYFYAREHVRIVQVLCAELVLTLNEMGIHAVKHLKDLTPMLSAIMTDPFASSSPSLLLSAISALQAVLTNCWPRIAASAWQDEIIQAVVFCWLHLNDSESGSRSQGQYQGQNQILVKEKLVVAVKTLAAILAAKEMDLVRLVAPLVEKEPALVELFAHAR